MAAAKKKAAVGDSVFYKWQGAWLPAIVVMLHGDTKKEGAATLNVFTPNGVMVVKMAEPGNGDVQYAYKPGGAVREEPDTPDED